jgi:phage terminase Nu1 subunit (DNA packaging protein)
MRTLSVPKKSSQPATLKGWKAIADYLGLTPATAQHWARSGMPVKREGRFTTASPDEIQAWIGRESHMPKAAHVMTKGADVASALKDSLAVIRKHPKPQKEN